MHTFENVLYDITRVFLAPVLVILSAMFVYALYSLGVFLVELFRPASRGMALTNYRLQHEDATISHLELRLLQLLEPLRLISRTAPMLGLVATMIPMGPALVAVASGNSRGVAENLVVAFSAVIIALLSAAISFKIGRAHV